MILDAPTFTSLVDAKVTLGDTLTITAARNSSGHSIRCYARIWGAAAWTLAGTIASGAGGSTGTLIAATLAVGKVHEVVLVSLDGSDVSLPTITRRAVPTTGTGSIPERAVASVMAAVETITVANGFFATVAAVFRGGPEPLKAVGYPHAFVELDECFGSDMSTVGGQGLQEFRLGVNVWMVTKSYGAAGHTQAEAIRMHDAIIQAVMLDNERGGAAIDTIPSRWSPFCGTDDQPTAGIAVRFELLVRFARNNPTLLIPT